MSSRLFLRPLGGAAAFVVLMALLALLRREQPPVSGAEPLAAAKRSSPDGEERTAKNARKRTRRKPPPPIRLQTDVKLAATSAAPFRNPEELAFKSFNELCLTTHTFDTKNVANLGLPQSFELLCYNGQPVGPTIRVRRGSTFHIRVKNILDTKGKKPSGPPDSDKTPPNPKAQKPMDLCLTNLHTHGLHVSPVGNADNIFRSIAPTEEFTFEYTLPANHPAGTFWYHPHLHGAVAYQLSNGVAGALIVEGSPKDGINDLDKIPEIARAYERILVFQLHNYVVGDDKTARIDATSIYNVTPDAYGCKALSVTGNHDNTNQVTAINGVINPVIALAPREVQRWRLVHAGWDIDRRLTLTDENGNPTDEIKLYEIALDGLATGRLEEKSNDLNKGALVEIAPGQRSDVLIKAKLLDKDWDMGGSSRTYLLKQDPADTIDNQSLYLAKIVVSGTPRPMNLPQDARALARCKPFASVRDEELATTGLSPIAKTGLQFSADDDSAPPVKPPPMRKPHYTINDKTFADYFAPDPQHKPNPYPHPTVPMQIQLDSAEEWTITAALSGHPFHIHVNPFQVVKVNGKELPQEQKVWRDTLYLPDGTTYTIRSRFRDFLGLTVIHCHILDHEDQGMMLPIEFIRPDQTPVVPTFPPPGKLKQTAFPAPGLKLPDVSGKEFALAELRGRKVVLVFFQGLQCLHCREKLRDLLRDARAKAGFDAEIVAVSSQPIADLASVREYLGALDGIHLLVDENYRAFRAFGCYDNGPRHGLFLVDGKGVIRAGYTGEAPFVDTPEVIRRVQGLDGTAPRSASR